jgi:hypothetical protein
MERKERAHETNKFKPIVERNRSTRPTAHVDPVNTEEVEEVSKMKLRDRRNSAASLGKKELAPLKPVRGKAGMGMPPLPNVKKPLEPIRSTQQKLPKQLESKTSKKSGNVESEEGEELDGGRLDGPELEGESHFIYDSDYVMSSAPMDLGISHDEEVKTEGMEMLNMVLTPSRKAMTSQQFRKTNYTSSKGEENCIEDSTRDDQSPVMGNTANPHRHLRTKP